MITKGIVEKIISPYLIKVRLPIFDKIEEAKDSTKVNDLSEATICTLPNSGNQVDIGDIVFVGFEDNDYSKPIILGHLFKESLAKANIDITTRLFTTTSLTKLYKQTYIGEVTPQEIECLKNIESNIQGQLKVINERLDKLEGNNE